MAQKPHVKVTREGQKPDELDSRRTEEKEISKREKRTKGGNQAKRGFLLRKSRRQPPREKKKG